MKHHVTKRPVAHQSRPAQRGRRAARPGRAALLAAGICLAVTACAGSLPTTLVSQVASTPAAAPTPPAALDGPYPVTRVVDGDTLSIERHGTNEKIRLIGVDTPELYDPRKPVQCYGQEASDYTKTLLGQHIYLETDPSQDSIDRYGRTLAYVWTDTGALVNLDLIAGGYAHEYTYNDPYRYQQEFRAAQQQAQDNNTGLWSPTNCPSS